MNVIHPRQCYQRKMIEMEREHRNKSTRRVFESNMRIRGKLLLQEIGKNQNSSLILRQKMIRAKKQRAQHSSRVKEETYAERYQLPDLIVYKPREIKQQQLDPEPDRKPDCIERAEKGERPGDRTDRTDRFDRLDRLERIEKSDRIDRGREKSLYRDNNSISNEHIRRRERIARVLQQLYSNQIKEINKKATLDQERRRIESLTLESPYLVKMRVHRTLDL